MRAKKRAALVSTDAHDELAALQALLAQANKEHPDPKTLEELRRVYDHVPKLWQWLGDMTAHVQRDIVKSMMGGPGGQEALTRHVQAMRDGLGYHEAAALERSLIDHVVTCWLRLTQVEWSYTQVVGQASSPQARAEHWERRLTAAQKRYLRACESLARVRRLSRPAAPLQVNIGGQQVNQVQVTPEPE